MTQTTRRIQVGLIGLGALALIALVYGITRSSLSPSIDARGIEEAMQEIEARTVPAVTEETRAALERALDNTLRTLEDGHGHHYFIDSQIGDRVPRVPPAMRETHRSVLSVLRSAPIELSPSDRDRNGLGERIGKVAQAFTRIGHRALQQKDTEGWEIAADYVESAIRLRLTERRTLRLASLWRFASDALELGGMARDVSSRESRLKVRMQQVLKLFFRQYPSAREAVDNEAFAIWRDGERSRRDRYTAVAYLLTLRDVFFTPPTAAETPPALVPRVAELEDRNLHETGLKAYQAYWATRSFLKSFIEPDGE